MARSWLRILRAVDPVAAGIGSLAVVAAAIGAVSRTWDRDPATISPVAAAGLPLTAPASALNLGDLGYRRFIEVPLPLTNSGAETVAVDRFQPSCGCTAVSPSSLQLEPGETATVWVRVDMQKYSPLFPASGVFDLHVSVDAVDDPEPSAVEHADQLAAGVPPKVSRFEMAGRVLAPILPSVTSLHFPSGAGLYAGGPSVSRSFILRPADRSQAGALDADLAASVPTARCDRGDVRLEALDEASGGGWKVTYTPDNSADALAELSDVIRIETASVGDDMPEASVSQKDEGDQASADGAAANVPSIDPAGALPDESVLSQGEESSRIDSAKTIDSREDVIETDVRHENAPPAYAIEIPVTGKIESDLHALPEVCHLGWVWAGETFRDSFVVAKYSDSAPVEIEVIGTTSPHLNAKSRKEGDSTAIDVELVAPAEGFESDEEKRFDLQIVTSDGDYLSVPVTFEWVSSKGESDDE